MKITLQSTTQLVTIVRNGVEVPARVWEGETESGVKCHALITRIAVHKDDDASQFERELKECEPPSPQAMQAIPMRFFID